MIKKETYLSTFFIDLEGRVSFAYVLVRDQNLVVRGRNRRLICFVFFISFWKKFWKKKPSGKMSICLCFYVIRKMTWNMIKIDCNLIYERIKIRRSLDFGNQGLL